MKIRTDFVTNSSSSSFVTLHIQSKPLAELFAQHQEALSEHFSPDRDFYGKLNISGDAIVLDGGVPDGSIDAEVPREPDDFVWCLAALLSEGNVTEAEHIEDGEFDSSLEELLRELFNREQELKDSLEKVYWEGGNEGHCEYDGSISQYFTYDPVNGPSYYVEETQGMDDEDWEESDL